MKVQPFGHVLGAENGMPWMASHAGYPAPILGKRGLIRVFFTARDADKRGHTGWCDVRIDNPTRVVAISSGPLFSLGPPGAFDDAGTGVGNVVRSGRELRLYYLGWNLARSVPSHNSIGMAVGNAAGSRFRRAFMGPLIDRDRFDPFTFSYPFVTRERGRWVMYYGTNHGSLAQEKTMAHDLTKAYSRDGIEWHRTRDRVLGLKRGEFALARPWIIPGKNAVMMFTIYGKRRRIGLAQKSSNGSWRRVDDDFVPRSAGWASDDVCYASHIRAGGRDLIFYCGNEYGRTGFGVAELKP